VIVGDNVVFFWWSAQQKKRCMRARRCHVICIGVG